MIEKPPDIEPPKPVADGKPNGNGSHNVVLKVQPRVELPRGARPRRPLGLVIIGAISVIAILAIVPNWIQKWLWMRQVGYSGVFWTLFSVRWELFGAAFVVALLYLWINLRVAAKNGSTFRVSSLTGESALATKLSVQISPAVLSLAMGVGAAIVALFYAFTFYTKWDTYLRFRYGGSFGLSDPLFGRDAGFYVFRLPFYELLQNSLTTLAVITFLAILAFYAYFGIAGFQPRKTGGRMEREGRSTLVQPVLRPGRQLGMGLLPGSLRTALLHSGSRLWSRLHRRSCHPDRLLDHGGRRGGAVRAAGAQFLPAAIQSDRDRIRNFCRLVHRRRLAGASPISAVQVQPNELARETPFLKNNIAFTRTAFSLDKIQETSYPALADLTPEMIARNQDTIQNIRLWDYRPLLQMYQQAQEIRLYYQFYEVDVDRYHLPDGYHQVMLSTRELSPELPAQAQTWVNEKLQFTHGLWLGDELRLKDDGGRLSRSTCWRISRPNPPTA